MTEPSKRIKAERQGTGLSQAELAADETLVVTLGITPEEWRALWSIRLPGEATKAGHVQLLYTIRAVSRPAGSVTES